MRKSLFFTVVLSLCMAEFGAFAANQRGVRGNANTNTATQSATTNNASASVSARAGTRQKVVSNAAASTSGNVSARAGKKQTVKTGVVSARAGTTQKVINTGTKVATATENTAVPEECQNAFYGCMDAFCMLDNASGGRCQCNDRITELDAVLDEIVKLDEQSYIMATEGVERIQMGEAEEEIMKRAKAAGDKAVAGENSAGNKKKVRTLDLSVFNNSIFNDLDDDAFEMDAQQSILDKKGNALYNEAVKMCGAQIPAQCKTYGSMLSLVYGQKIKSDCIAYENSLKAQKNQSQQKLQTAQKALRDAALDEYKNQNKYATTGECVIAFTQCMKTTAECGEDYTGCVTLAARENMKNTKAGSTKAKQTKIKGVVSGADITLAASTMESLLAKKIICERITKQCVNSNKNDAVWNGFLRNAAPALKSAELIAEQNLRDNCIPNVAECFSKACKSKFGDNDESYDMCLSNPDTYKALCKVQLEPCLEATGGSFEDPKASNLWNGLVAMLNAMKVDACTKEVKDCLLSEDRCGKDYAGCIGLDTATIGDLCPWQKLTACMGEKDDKGVSKYDKDTVKQYVAQVAQGLALQIDNSLATVCQNAADEAMIKACGDTESCDAATFDLSSLEEFMNVQACTRDDTECHSQIAAFDSKILKSRGVHAELVGLVDVSGITTDTGKENGYFKYNGKHSVKFDSENTKQVTELLDSALMRIMNQINADPKVQYCMTGREVQGFEKDENDIVKKIGKKDVNNVRFQNLTDNYKGTIANTLLEKLLTENSKLKGGFADKLVALDNEITANIATAEEEVDKINEKNCLETLGENGDYESAVAPAENACNDTYLSHRKTLTYDISEYDSETNECVIKTTRWYCTDWHKPWFCDNYCSEFGEGSVLSTKRVPMTKL